MSWLQGETFEQVSSTNLRSMPDRVSSANDRVYTQLHAGRLTPLVKICARQKTSFLDYVIVTCALFGTSAEREMLKWFQGGAGKTNVEKAQSRRVRIMPCCMCSLTLCFQVDNHYQAFNNDQLYNPFTEVLVLTGGCVSSIHQIDLIEESK